MSGSGLALAMISLAGCNSSAKLEAVNAAAVSPPAAQPAAPQLKPPSTPAAQLDGEQAMQYVRKVVSFGPRPVASAAHQKLEDYLRAELKPYHLEEDAFAAKTPVGAFPMRNFIAKFPGTKDGIIVLAGHYDTVRSIPNFVGANDGGSSTGILLELAKKLAAERGARPLRQGYSVWLVWFDGEEALVNWTATDSAYGSRHLAQKWQQNGTLKKVKAFLLADMVGDADLNIDRDQNSTPWLLDTVYGAAKRLGYQSYFFARSIPVDDDHMPFQRMGVHVADLIDFDYGYNNVFWHTPQDTLDKLSPRSLAIVGSVMLETLHWVDQK